MSPPVSSSMSPPVPAAIQTFADILAPVTPETFFEQYHGRQPLHIPGAADKLASVMSWPELTQILNQSNIWSARSLMLVMDKRTLDPAEYCRPAKDRDNRDNLLVDFDRLVAWLRQGATLACNDIDSLTPGLKTTARALEQALGGKAQANLYCSWKAHQAFDVHFDTHDVYALHIAGEKRWKVYGCHIPDPIAHPAFKTLGQDYHTAHKGRLTMDLIMQPGDVLYLPRGWYHEAMAVSPGTFHIAFGVTSVIGLDVINALTEFGILDPLFRASLPRLAAADGETAVAGHLAALGDRLAEMARDPAFIERFTAHMREFHYPRSWLSLPGDAIEQRYRLKAPVALFEKDGKWLLGDKRKAVPVPPPAVDQVRWILSRPGFAEREFHAAFPVHSETERRRLLADMVAMKVTEPA